MRRSYLAAELLLVTGAYALPEISIAKRDRHTHGQTRDVANGLVKRQDAGTVETNVFDILTYSAGGAYYANGTICFLLAGDVARTNTPSSQSPTALPRKTK